MVSMAREEWPCEEIAMDLVAELPESGGFNAILVVTNRFIEVYDNIAAKTTWLAEDMADFQMNNIWKLYGLLRHIPSNGGLQFDSKFLAKLN